MHGLETIKRMNQEACNKEQRDFASDCIENKAILEAIRDDVVEQLTRELKLTGSIPGHKVA